MPLGLDGEVGRGRTFHENFARLNFKRLLGLGRFDKRSRDDYGSADVELGNLGEISELRAVYNLYLRKKRAVGEIDEAEVLRRAQIAHPAAELDLLAGVCRGIFKKRANGNQFFHLGILLSYSRKNYRSMMPASSQALLVASSQRLHWTSPM